MISTLASFLAVIYVPTMWFMMALMFVLALLGFTSPDRLRRVFSIFTQLGPSRVLGFILVLVGAEIFIWATRANMSVWIRVVGVLFFLAGGVSLLVPTMTVILSENLVAMSDGKYRILGIVFLGLSVLFYIAQAVPLLHS
jgi:uncharacterized protein YjeT (DUF2065 family)